MKSKFFFLVFGLFCLANTTDLTAQKVATTATALKITPKKATFIQDEGIIVHDTKLSTADASALIALLKANPSAGYLQIVDAKGNVQTYGNADLNTTKLKGTAVSSFGIKSSGGLAATDVCSFIVMNKCNSISDKSSMMFKAQALLNGYK
jgi:hypothetical protein